MRAVTSLSLALPGALALVLGGCTKLTPVELAAVEPCGQENQALNGVQSFRVLSNGAEPDNVIAFTAASPAGFDIGLGDSVVLTVEGFGDDITLGEDPTAPAVKPKSVGRTVPLTINEQTPAVRGNIMVGKIDAFGSPRDLDGNCSAMDSGASVPGRHGHTATYIPGVNKVLIYGGAVWVEDAGEGGARVESFLKSAELYDPTTGFFEQLPEIKPARAYHTATALPDGKVAIWGGFATLGGNTDLVGSIQLVDVRNVENPYLNNAGGIIAAPARAHHTASLLADANMLVAVGGCADVASGCTPGGASGTSTNVVPAVEILNLADLTKTINGPSLATARAMHQAVAFPAGDLGVIAVIGGLNGTGPLGSVELLQVSGNTMQNAGAKADALPAGVVRHQAAVFDPNVPRKFIVTGGQNAAPSGVLSDVEPGSAAVTICSFVAAEISCIADPASLQTTRYGHNMARLRDGTTFVVMGGVTPDVSASAEARRVSPGGGEIVWGATTGALAESRQRAALTLLGGDGATFINQVFLSGGHTADKITSNRTDIFFGP